MNTTEFVQSMPKVELNLQLEGALNRANLLTIAEQNDFPDTDRHFQNKLSLYDKPDFKRLSEVIRLVTNWLQYPEDLSRIVYDACTLLSKQNVRYAEILLNPVLFEHVNSQFDQLIEVMNDGRDRAKRAWNIDVQWIVTVNRDEPRRSDDFARYVSAASARKNGLIGLGLTGNERLQPVGQFERAFRTVEKKDIPRAVSSGHDAEDTEELVASLDHLNPTRLMDAWGVLSNAGLVKRLGDAQLPIVISLTHALRQGWVSSMSEYPLRQLYDEGLKIVLSSPLPSLVGATLNDEYIAAVDECGLSLDELAEIALNGVDAAFLPEDTRSAMREEFSTAYSNLRAGENS